MKKVKRSELDTTRSFGWDGDLAEKRRLWKKLGEDYPELKETKNICQRNCCERKAIRGIEGSKEEGKYCIKHCRIDLHKYSIPWMCTGTVKRNSPTLRQGMNQRCIRMTYRDTSFCAVHKEGSGCGRKIKEHDEAVASSNPKDWVKLKKWRYNSPIDMVRLLEETTNRTRMGTIKIQQARTIVQLSEQLMATLVTLKDMGVGDEEYSKINGKKMPEPVELEGKSMERKIINIKEKMLEQKEKREREIKAIEMAKEAEARGG